MPLPEKFFLRGSADIPLTARKPACEPVYRSDNRFTVIGIALCDADIRQSARTADNRAEPESAEPSGGSFTAFCRSSENPVPRNADVPADTQRSGINDATSCFFTDFRTELQKYEQRENRCRRNSGKPPICNRIREFRTTELPHSISVKLSEIPTADHVKADRDGHDFTDISPAEQTLPTLSDQAGSENRFGRPVKLRYFRIQSGKQSSVVLTADDVFFTVSSFLIRNNPGAEYRNIPVFFNNSSNSGI